MASLYSLFNITPNCKILLFFLPYIIEKKYIYMTKKILKFPSQFFVLNDFFWGDSFNISISDIINVEAGLA